MVSQSQWRALKLALQREAEAIFYSAGEVVLIESRGESDSELLVTSATKHLKLSHVPERDAVRWETPKKYGFEPLSGAPGHLARSLVRHVHRG